MKIVLYCFFLVGMLLHPHASTAKDHSKDGKKHFKVGIDQTLVGKRIKYADEATRKRVEKFLQPVRFKKNGRLMTNPHYNVAFAQLIGRLERSKLRFYFKYNPNTEHGKGGYISFDGEKVMIVFGHAGLAYGGHADHILFEEAKHAEQVLNGQVYFVDPDQDGNWGVVTSIQAEVDAKLFVIDHLTYLKTYVDPATQVNCPTQLGMLAKKRADPEAMRHFLKYGAKNLRVMGGFTVNIPAAYPTYTMKPIIYFQKKVMSDSLVAFPYRRRK